MTEVTTHNSNTQELIADINNTAKMCEALMQSPHYQKMGREGVFAIVEKARATGVPPLDALNGGMYYVQGKVELSANMMNQLIRMHKHSVTKDKRSDETVCILHGKRADNGDTWVESFSIHDAKLAGIYKNQWLKYPKDMLFARALSRLARQLFPDVIKGCYVQGEISEALPLNVPVPMEKEEQLVERPPMISDEQYQELETCLENDLPLRQNILKFLKTRWGIETLQEMPVEIFDHAIKRAKERQGEAEDEVELEEVAS